eukprot:5902479-Amphidinium_carterae.1
MMKARLCVTTTHHGRRVIATGLTFVMTVTLEAFTLFLFLPRRAATPCERIFFWTKIENFQEP